MESFVHPGIAARWKQNPFAPAESLEARHRFTEWPDVEFKLSAAALESLQIVAAEMEAESEALFLSAVSGDLRRTWLVAVASGLLQRYLGKSKSIAGIALKGTEAKFCILRLNDDETLDLKRLVLRLQDTARSADANLQSVSSLPEIRSIIDSDANESPLRILITSHDDCVQPSEFDGLDLHIFAAGAAEPDRVIVRFNPQICTEGILGRYLANLANLCERLPQIRHTPLCEMEFVCEAEMAELARFNATQTHYPADQTICDLFDEITRRAADQDAVVTIDRRLTYSELNARANRLATRLRDRGIKRGDIVAIMLPRGMEAIIGFIAALKAGAAYLPVNPSDPVQRQRQLLKSCGVRAVIVGRTVTPADAVADFDPSATLVIDEESPDGSESAQPISAGAPDDLAYVMFTSGTTGEPKGVMVEHRNVIRLVRNTNYFDPLPGDRILQTGAFEFDAATFEIWGALLNGLTLYIPDADSILSPTALAQRIERWKITTLWLTAPLFSQLAAADPGTFANLKRLLIGGDALPVRQVNSVRSRSPHLTIINGYGPTENTTFSTAFVIDRDYSDSIPIGRPISNSTAYVIERNGKIAPMGVIGELYVGGDGVARGYLNSPELTSERFVEVAGLGRMYRTGDQARWNADGNLEFLGRWDDQLKIRGFRVDPAEIEAVLRRHPEIDEAVVLGMRDKHGERFLGAFVVAHRPLDADSVRAHVAQFLPSYQVPAYFDFLDRFPFTSHGKIDRAGLVQRQIEKSVTPGTHDAVPPRLSAIWQDVLGQVAASPSDNFFDGGGHSMKAIALLSRIRTEFGVEVSLRDFLLNPTLSNLAKSVQTRPIKVKSRIPVEPIRPWYHLSASQQRLVEIWKQNPQSAAFNIVKHRVWNSKFDCHIAARVMAYLTGRHDSLRTRLEKRDTGYVQIIESQVTVPLVVVDLTKSTLTAAREARARIHETERRTPIPIDGPLLWRARLVIYGQEETELLLTIHHVVCDGWSLDVLDREFDAVYDDYAAGKESSLPPIKLQFKDYVAWHNRFLADPGQHREAAEFWNHSLAGPLRLVAPPHDRGGTILKSRASAGYRIVLPRRLTSRLRTFAADNRTSLFVVLFAAYQKLLYELTGEQDFIIGIPSANRDDEALHQTVGFIVDTVLIRCRSAQTEPFVDFVKQVGDSVFDSLQYAHYTSDLGCKSIGTVYAVR